MSETQLDKWVCSLEERLRMEIGIGVIRVKVHCTLWVWVRSLREYRVRKAEGLEPSLWDSNT